MQSSERRLRRGLDAIRNGLLGGEIAGAQQSEAVDQLHLFVGRTADQPAVVELRRGKRSRQAGFAAGNAGNPALHQQAGGDHAAPGGDPVEPDRCLVGIGIEMACAPRQGIEQGGAIAAIAARQDVRRVSGPEQDALTPQVGAPGVIGPGPVGEQPAAGERLSELGAFFPTRRSGKVAQLARIRLPRDSQHIPEISANKYALNIRFTQFGDEPRPKMVDCDVEFELTFCNL